MKGRWGCQKGGRIAPTMAGTRSSNPGAHLKVEARCSSVLEDPTCSSTGAF